PEICCADKGGSAPAVAGQSARSRHRCTHDRWRGTPEFQDAADDGAGFWVPRKLALCRVFVLAQVPTVWVLGWRGSCAIGRTFVEHVHQSSADSFSTRRESLPDTVWKSRARRQTIELS